MKKIIIIGNGFDLAHGLKTSYYDFLLDYLDNLRNILQEDAYYEDQFLRVECNIDSPFLNSEIFKKKNSIEWFNLHADNKFRPVIKLEDIVYNDEDFDVYFHSDFFKEIYSDAKTKNWVDIESIFFKLIVRFQKNIILLERLNKDMEILKNNYLLKYLEKEIHKDRSYIDYYEDLFASSGYTSLLFLTFNYTSVINKYFKEAQQEIARIHKNRNSKHAKLLYIHGGLNSGRHGEPIFGIGDEHHKDYESLRDSEHLTALFKHNKFTGYMKNSNYRELENYLDYALPSKTGTRTELETLSLFDVEIYGHSCGSSDRTLFKQILQHDNCRSIKICYYDKIENYTNNVIELSRHFDDPVMFRKRVMPYEEAFKMPQYYD